MTRLHFFFNLSNWTALNLYLIISHTEFIILPKKSTTCLQNRLKDWHLSQLRRKTNLFATSIFVSLYILVLLVSTHHDIKSAIPSHIPPPKSTMAMNMYILKINMLCGEREKETDRERESNRVKTWQTLKYLPLQCTCVIIIHIGKHKICLYTQAQDHSWPQKTSTTYMQKVQKLKNYYFCVTKFKYGDLEDAISYRNSHQNMTWLCKENTLHGCPTLLSQYTTLFHRTETIRLLFSPRIIYSHS